VLKKSKRKLKKTTRILKKNKKALGRMKRKLKRVIKKTGKIPPNYKKELLSILLKTFQLLRKKEEEGKKLEEEKKKEGPDPEKKGDTIFGSIAKAIGSAVTKKPQPMYAFVVVGDKTDPDNLRLALLSKGPTVPNASSDKRGQDDIKALVRTVDPRFNPSNDFETLTTNAYDILVPTDISGVIYKNLKAAATWINDIKDPKVKNMIRILLHKYKFPIEYPKPAWMTELMGDGSICESSKKLMEEAVKYSEEQRAIYNIAGMEQYAELVAQSTGAETEDERKAALSKLNKKYGTRSILAIKDGATAPHPLDVPNPYAAASYRDAVTTFADPAGFTDEAKVHDPSGTYHAMNMRLAEELIPNELLVDPKLTTAILESLWYCGRNPSLSNDPRCFMSRFLGEFRLMKERKIQITAAEAVKQMSVWPNLQRVLHGLKASLPGKPFFFNPALKAPTPMDLSSGSLGSPGSPGSLGSPVSPGSLGLAPSPPVPISRLSLGVPQKGRTIIPTPTRSTLRFTGLVPLPTRL
jgi:hypothetical protein